MTKHFTHIGDDAKLVIQINNAKPISSSWNSKWIVIQAYYHDKLTQRQMQYLNIALSFKCLQYNLKWPKWFCSKYIILLFDVTCFHWKQLNHSFRHKNKPFIQTDSLSLYSSWDSATGLPAFIYTSHAN